MAVKGLKACKCLAKVTFTNIKGPLSKTFKLLKVLFSAVVTTHNLSYAPFVVLSL